MQHGTLVLIKRKQTVLRCYSLINCVHTKKLTVLLKHVNPSIKFVATTENTHYNFKPFDRSCSQKTIIIWQDVWSNGKIAVHRPRKHTSNFLKKQQHYDGCSIRVVDCSIRVFRFLATFRLCLTPIV